MGDKAPPKLVPRTLENTREEDVTTVEVKTDGAKEALQDDEVDWDIANDEFKDFFERSYEPKVLITSGDNPHSVRK